MQMFKIKYESCMILVRRYSKGYAILSFCPKKSYFKKQATLKKKKSIYLYCRDRFVFLGTSLLTHHEED